MQIQEINIKRWKETWTRT